MERLISGALDGELTPEQRDEVEAWLAAHPGDKALQDAWLRLGDQVRRVAPVECPDAADAWRDVQAAIHAAKDTRVEEIPDPTPVLPWRLGWAAASIGIVVIGLFALASLQLGRGTLAERGSVGHPPDVEFAESGIPGATMMIYADHETGMTVIWMDVDDSRNGQETPGEMDRS
jgi:anti-sigma factor RsiW